MEKTLIEIPFDLRVDFVSRKNRFLGKVRLKDIDSLEDVHIRDPGRLEEILYSGNEVLLKRVESDTRKTDWDILAGNVNGDWIFINSGYHREIAEAILRDPLLNPFGQIENFEAEKKLGESRIDFLLEKGDKDIWLEVKGCTLAKDGKALFPDAPTERGKRHVEELIQVNEEKDSSAALVFLVFRPDACCFAPHEKQDPEFSKSFREAQKAGVDVHALKLRYDGGAVYYLKEIPICEVYKV